MKMRSRDWFGRLALLLLPCFLSAAEPERQLAHSPLIQGGTTTEAAAPMVAHSPLLYGWLLRAAEPAQTAVNSSHVYGWIETIRLQPDGVELEAKLDTGADTSSLDARNIELFSRDGEKWVRFRVDGLRQGAGVSQAFERPVLRRIKVRGAGGADHRVVVRMRLCIGQQEFDEQFSLRDRSDMAYPVLLGRRTLAHLGPVDVTHTHQHPASCVD